MEDDEPIVFPAKWPRNPQRVRRGPPELAKPPAEQTTTAYCLKCNEDTTVALSRFPGRPGTCLTCRTRIHDVDDANPVALRGITDAQWAEILGR
jgi:hypothetical protein